MPICLEQYQCPALDKLYTSLCESLPVIESKIQNDTFDTVTQSNYRYYLLDAFHQLRNNCRCCTCGTSCQPCYQQYVVPHMYQLLHHLLKNEKNPVLRQHLDRKLYQLDEDCVKHRKRTCKGNYEK